MSKISVQDLYILLVEPSSTQRRIIRERLKAAGNTNLEAVSGQSEAWQSMLSAEPDLVMSAMYFDEGTGSDLLYRMRQHEGLADVPFMLISSESRYESLDPIKQAGVQAILPKPFSVDDLRMALESTTDYMAPEMLTGDGYFDPDEIRVLVVDDSVTARNHIVRLLGNMGLQRIVVARDGVEAVKMLEETLFDVVITDFNMPEMDGERLTNYIRHHSEQTTLPILMVTSEHDAARLDSVMRSGVSAICDKPFSAGTVMTLLRQLLI